MPRAAEAGPEGAQGAALEVVAEDREEAEVEVVPEGPEVQAAAEDRGPAGQAAVQGRGLQGDRGIRLEKGLKPGNKCSSNRISK